MAKFIHNSRGTMETCTELDITSSNDIVYLRTNIRQINEEDFVGFEYDETQMSKSKEYPIYCETGNIVYNDKIDI